jgi:hypothetical protein
MHLGAAPERGTTIRAPSTANFLIDSRDGIQTSGSSSNFIIAPPQSLLNGFFTRIGVPEMALEWSEPNVSAGLLNNTIQYDVSGFAILNLTVADGFYTVQQALTALTAALNAASASVGGLTWTLAGANGAATLTPSVGTAQARLGDALPSRLGLQPAGLPYSAPGAALVVNPALVDLRPYRYIDFVSNELTYNQNLKDATTSRTSRDILARWYFDWDVPPTYDGFGFPIYMGYSPFKARRQFFTAKQVKWESNMPIGQLSFQVFPDAGIQKPIPMLYSLWEMTLLVSEV